MISNKEPSLCWDCANACGDCSWSRHYDKKAVKGWTVREKLVTVDGDIVDESYCVIKCPEFIRDAMKGGLVRVKE